MGLVELFVELWIDIRLAVEVVDPLDAVNFDHRDPRLSVDLLERVLTLPAWSRPRLDVAADFREFSWIVFDTRVRNGFEVHNLRSIEVELWEFKIHVFSSSDFGSSSLKPPDLVL